MSRIYKNERYHVEVMGTDKFKEQPDATGRIEFWSGTTHDPNLIFFRSSLSHTIQLSEKTARAMANNILRQCDEIKRGV